MTDHKMYIGYEREVQDCGSRWVIVVVKPNNRSCKWYSVIGGPEGPDPDDAVYEHEQIEEKDFKKSDFDDTMPIGWLKEGSLKSFEAVFHRLTLGPNQYFIVRLVYELFKNKLVQRDFFTDLLKKAKYTAAEWDFFGEEYCEVDKQFRIAQLVTVKMYRESIGDL
ncbi:hypothetical protein BDW59DRAFT_157946 [Aspergillus cavernicola]|uniref:Uncharacterized protein n=1 Tax=Aspergillus cavernicola TaxID=176166 RepID=A0ABR4IUR8_9EURO